MRSFLLCYVLRETYDKGRSDTEGTNLEVAKRLLRRPKSSQVDFTESGTEGANLEFPKGILWQSSVTSTCDLVRGPRGSSTLQPPAAEGFTPLCSINPTPSRIVCSASRVARGNVTLPLESPTFVGNLNRHHPSISPSVAWLHLWMI